MHESVQTIVLACRKAGFCPLVHRGSLAAALCRVPSSSRRAIHPTLTCLPAGRSSPAAAAAPPTPASPDPSCAAAPSPSPSSRAAPAPQRLDHQAKVIAPRSAAGRWSSPRAHGTACAPRRKPDEEILHEIAVTADPAAIRRPAATAIEGGRPGRHPVGTQLQGGRVSGELARECRRIAHPN